MGAMTMRVVGAALALVVATAACVFAALTWPPAAALVVAAVVLLLVAVVRPRLLAPIAICFAVAASAGVGVRLISDSEGASYLVLRSAVAVIAVGASTWQLPRILRLIGREFWLLLPFGWALLSLSWSTELRSSVQLLIGMVTAVLVGAVLATFTPTTASRTLLWATASATGVSVLLAMFVPGIGRINTIRPGEGLVSDPVGLFAWNSDLGLVASIAAVLAAGLWFARRKRFYIWATLALLAATVYSESATSMIAAVVGIGSVIWVGVRKLRPIIMIAAIVSIPIWLTGGELFNWVLGLVGRSSDLTGRSVIWPYAVSLIQQRPLVGYGIGSAPSMTVFGFDAGHAHNGFLQLALELGLVGAALFVASFIVIVIRLIRRGSPVLVGAIALFVVANMANNYLMTAGIAAVVYGWVAYSTVRPPRDQQDGLTVVRSAALPEGTGRRTAARL